MRTSTASRRPARPVAGLRGPPTCSTATFATFVLAAAFAALATGIPMSEKVFCHVCGAGVGRSLFPGLPPSPDCQAEQDTTRECPAGYKGCLTTYNGVTLTRTCGERAYDPCEVANGVVYCYCSGRLCNAQTRDAMRQRRCALLRSHAPEDDEDALSADGGSGSGEVPGLFDDCESGTTGPPAPVPTATPKADPDVDRDADGVPGKDDADWEVTAENGAEPTANTTAKADGKGGARRAHGSVLCVLVAVLVALCATGADARR